MAKTRRIRRKIKSKKLVLEYFERGYRKYEDREYGVACEEFSRAIRQNKNFIDVFIWRGESLRATGKPELALKDYDKVSSMLPEKEIPTIFYYFRSIAYADLGDMDNAFVNMCMANIKMKEEREIGKMESIDLIMDHLDKHYIRISTKI